MERRTYSQEFKLEAVQLSYDSDISVSQVAENLGIRPELLYRWRSEQRREGNDAFPDKGKSKPSEPGLAPSMALLRLNQLSTKGIIDSHMLSLRR